MFKIFCGTLAGFAVIEVGKTAYLHISPKLFGTETATPEQPQEDANVVVIEGPISFDTFKKFKTDFKKAVVSSDHVVIKLESFGGCASSTQLISNVITNCKKDVYCKVDSYALSAGALIALSCDKIYMEETAVISPIDPIIVEDDKKFLMRDYPASIRRAIDMNAEKAATTLRVSVKDHYEAESQELYFNAYKDRVRKLLSKKHSVEVVDGIIKNMIDTYQPHNRFYTFEEAKEIVPYVKVITDYDGDVSIKRNRAMATFF